MMNEVVDLKNYSDLKLDQNPPLRVRFSSRFDVISRGYTNM